MKIGFQKIYSIQAEFYLSDTIIQIFLWQSIIMHTAHLIGDLKHIYSLCCPMTMNFGLAILKKCLNLTNKHKRANMLVSRRNSKSVAYPAGTITDFACGQIVPKYLKFAYSAHFGFNVMRSNVSIDEAACDSMLTFVVDGAVLVRRL